MSARDNGGPAFPRDHAHDGHNGMTLRDYFAAKAMQGYCAREESIECEYEAIANDAYGIADAMLAARGDA